MTSEASIRACILAATVSAIAVLLSVRVGAAETPPGAMPCNALCRWWMAIGQEPQEHASAPEAQAKAAAADRVPSAEHRPRGEEPAPRHVSGRDRGLPSTRIFAAAPAFPPARPAASRSASLWGVPLAGSVGIRPPVFARPGS